MEDFVKQWGYFAIFLGSLIEGESIILTAGFLSAQGYLSLPKIMLIAFCGTLIADQSLFFVGYFLGNRVLFTFPRLQSSANRAFDFLKKYNTIYILSFRFIYGIRIISPLIIGASGISVIRFAWLNVISALIWSIISCGTGYLFGDILINHLTPEQRLLTLSGLFVALLTVIIWKGHKSFFTLIRKNKRKT